MDGATFLWHIYFLSLAGIDRYMSANPAAPKNGFLPMLLYILEMHWVIHTFLCQVYQWRRAVAADRRKAGESVSAPQHGAQLPRLHGEEKGCGREKNVGKRPSGLCLFLRL